ncbi:MAG: SDR family oxidoreductase [Candidatus Zixiibacteriota bacterium]|nr:MAG: SDR family oxidoreductase [candidate division Zixibacteria bacterium]
MVDPGLSGKVALVTGGNNPHGIGAEIARTLATQDAAVFIHYYRQQADIPHDDTSGKRPDKPGLKFFFAQQKKTADEVADQIRKEGGKAQTLEGDLSNPTTVVKVFDATEKKLGPVDILVNNAADYLADTFVPDSVTSEEASLWNGGPLRSAITAESHDRHFAVNTRAAALLMAEFARRLVESGKRWGRIINISADCAWGSPGEISYRASKYALESYSRSAAAELGPFGITVNVVSPGPVQTGYIDTNMEESLIPDIPTGRIGRPKDIANAVLFFASEQASWITGQVLFVHGGHRMALGI